MKTIGYVTVYLPQGGVTIYRNIVNILEAGPNFLSIDYLVDGKLYRLATPLPYSLITQGD